MAVIALLTLSVPAAFATLGGDLASVAADQAQVGDILAVQQGARFAMHAMAAPSGTVVREFVSPAGIVFGVAWQGPTMPDLRQVLGPYFDRYMEAAAQRHRRGPVSIELPGLVVTSAGHMRAFVGKAYLPDAVPQGVTSDEIR